MIVVPATLHASTVAEQGWAPVWLAAWERQDTSRSGAMASIRKQNRGRSTVFQAMAVHEEGAPLGNGTSDREKHLCGVSESGSNVVFMFVGE